MRVKDPWGNEFESKEEMYRYYGISRTIYKYWLRRGKDVKDILLHKKSTRKTTPIQVTDDLGNVFNSISKMCRQYNIGQSTYKHRVKQGVEPVVCFCGTRIKSLHIEYIGIDNKAYYKIYKQNNLMTTREILSHYRPELLEAYDKYNPTGEYLKYNQDIE